MAVVNASEDDDKGMAGGVVAIIVILVLACLLGIVFLYKHKQGAAGGSAEIYEQPAYMQETENPVYDEVSGKMINDINRENPAYGSVGGGSHGLIGNDLYGDVLAAGSSARLASNAVYSEIDLALSRSGALPNAGYGQAATYEHAVSGGPSYSEAALYDTAAAARGSSVRGGALSNSMYTSTEAVERASTIANNTYVMSEPAARPVSAGSEYFEANGKSARRTSLRALSPSLVPEPTYQGQQQQSFFPQGMAPQPVDSFAASYTSLQSFQESAPYIGTGPALGSSSGSVTSQRRLSLGGRRVASEV